MRPLLPKLHYCQLLQYQHPLHYSAPPAMSYSAAAADSAADSAAAAADSAADAAPLCRRFIWMN